MSGTVRSSEIDDVRAAIDLVALVAEHVPLRPKGREHVGVCPFHDDHAPSLTVVTHKGSAFYKCHACGAAGDAFSFVMEYHKMSFGEALRFLADRAGVTLTETRGERGPGGSGGGVDRAALREANAAAAAFFTMTLVRSGPDSAARRTLAERGFDDEVVRAWGIGAAPEGWDGLLSAVRRRGLAPESFAAAGLLRTRTEGGHYDTFRNRLIFPIGDELGRPIAFGGRRLDPEDDPKYLNSPESPIFAKGRTLYGLNQARRAIIDRRVAIVAEGYTDVIACHRAGLTNTVATLGTALTRDHARILKRLCETVILLFDGDEAGQRAADRAVEVFFAEPVDVEICVLPDGHDPADLLARPDGRERLDAALAASADALTYKVDRFRSELVAASGHAGRHRVLEKLLGELAELGFRSMPGVRRRPVLARIADLLAVRIEEVEQALPRARATATTPVDETGDRPEPADALDDGTCSRARRLAERELLSLLISQPALRTQPGTRTLDVNLFQDPPSRAIASIVLAWLAEERDFTADQLMHEVEGRALRGLVADLYRDGQRRVGEKEGGDAGDAGDGVAAFVESIEALQGLIDRECYERELEVFRRRGAAGERDRHDEDALVALVERRRRQGYIPAAMPARGRT